MATPQGQPPYPDDNRGYRAPELNEALKIRRQSPHIRTFKGRHYKFLQINALYRMFDE